MGKKLTNENNLALKFPELVKEWHPTLNGSLTPNEVSFGSQKKIWWRCSINPRHEWESSIKNRACIGADCPFCHNYYVCEDNCLSVTHAELSNEWSPKNGNLTPRNVIAGSHKKVWWICSKGHEWEAALNNRAYRKQNCPYCLNRKVCEDNCLINLFPDLCKEWSPKNCIRPSDVLAGSHKKIWWRCSVNSEHEWEASVRERSFGDKGCPFCTNQRIYGGNCLATTHPELTKEWHLVLNGNLIPDDVIAGSDRKIWWQCNKGHEWEACINSRTATTKTGCPFCHNFYVCEDNCLATTHLELTKEWHPISNGSLTPNDVVAGSGKKIWWKCINCNYEWIAALYSRTSKDRSGCPKCNPGYNSNIQKNIAKELTKYFDFDPENYTVDCSGKSEKVDIQIKINDNKKFIIEYDGNYYHKDNLERDKKKTENLEAAEYTVIRIRECLPKIGKNDIVLRKSILHTDLDRIEKLAKRIKNKINKICAS